MWNLVVFIISLIFTYIFQANLQHCISFTLPIFLNILLCIYCFHLIHNAWNFWVFFKFEIYTYLPGSLSITRSIHILQAHRVVIKYIFINVCICMCIFFELLVHPVLPYMLYIQMPKNKYYQILQLQNNF